MHGQDIKRRNESQATNRVHLIPTRNPSLFNVELHLPFKTAYPGKLDVSGQGCFRARKTLDQLHKKLNAWGVCAELVERFNFKWVSLLCEGREYITTTGFLRRFGKRLTYRNHEAQYFLPIGMWGVDAVQAFEKQEASRPEQLSIFAVEETA